VLSNAQLAEKTVRITEEFERKIANPTKRGRIIPI
jgi:uncharacterized protein (DUF849 family)